MSRSLKISLAVLAAALAAGGCGEASSDTMPSGVVRVWGSRGRIDGTFVKPRVIDCLSGGDLAIIDRSGRVQVFSPEGAFENKFQLANAEKGYPTGMTVDSQGRMWIAETHAYRVAVYTRDFQEVFSVGGYGDDDGHFVYVTDVALSPDGKIYASDYGTTNRVQEFDREGRFVKVIGREGTEPGNFRRPQALLCTADGSLFVADAANHRIQKFTPSGELEGVYGSAGRGDGELLYPYDLAVGPDGMIYVLEYGNNRVQRMTADGRFEGTWSGGGRIRFASPWSIAVNGGSLYILDTGNSRVVEIDLAKAVWRTGGAP